MQIRCSSLNSTPCPPPHTHTHTHTHPEPYFTLANLHYNAGETEESQEGDLVFHVLLRQT